MIIVQFLSNQERTKIEQLKKTRFIIIVTELS